MSRAEFGRAVVTARRRTGRDWVQDQLASRLGVKRHTVVALENCNREVPTAVIVDTVQLFDDAELSLAAARYITGGLVGAVAGALCGTRTAAAMAMAVELEELRDDLARVQTDLIRAPSMADRDTVESVFCNVLDVLMTCNQLVIELSRDYGLSWRKMQAKHLREVRAKGYVRKENSRPSASRAA